MIEIALIMIVCGFSLVLLALLGYLIFALWTEK
jgi:hypothetical protein